MKYPITLFVTMLLVSSFTLPTTVSTKCKSVDLKAVEIQPPEWDHDNQQTVVKVTVQNIGSKTSKACRALLFDLDISVDQAKSMKLDKLFIEMIDENNGRAAYFTGDAAMFIDDNKFDYDRDFAVFASIPALKPGEKREFTFYIKDIWVYDSNCEIRLIVDIDAANKDCDTTNNILDLFGWG